MEIVSRSSDALNLVNGAFLVSQAPASVKTPTRVRDLAERYGSDLSFSFDSNGRSVWVMAVFGKGAPPALRRVLDGEVPWTPVDDVKAEDGTEED